jgi:hypothetical protein
MPTDMKHAETLLGLAERRALRAYVDRVGILAAVDRLRVGRESVARAIGGMPIRRGTIVIVRAALATVDREAGQA